MNGGKAILWKKSQRGKKHDILRLMLQWRERAAKWNRPNGESQKRFFLADNVKMHPILVSVSKIDDSAAGETS